MAAPPMPSRARAAITCQASVEKTAMSDASEKMPKPAMSSRLRPQRSPSAPAVTSRPDRASAPPPPASSRQAGHGVGHRRPAAQLRVRDDPCERRPAEPLSPRRSPPGSSRRRRARPAARPSAAPTSQLASPPRRTFAAAHLTRSYRRRGVAPTAPAAGLPAGEAVLTSLRPPSTLTAGCRHAPRTTTSTCVTGACAPCTTRRTNDLAVVAPPGHSKAEQIEDLTLRVALLTRHVASERRALRGVHQRTLVADARRIEDHIAVDLPTEAQLPLVAEAGIELALTEPRLT